MIRHVELTCSSTGLQLDASSHLVVANKKVEGGWGSTVPRARTPQTTYSILIIVEHNGEKFIEIDFTIVITVEFVNHRLKLLVTHIFS